LPDLSAALDLDLGTQNNVLVFLGRLASRRSPLRVAENYGSFEKRAVQLGPRMISKPSWFWVERGRYHPAAAIEDESGAGLQ